MSWTWATATCRGTSHVRAGTRCQDRAACVALGPSKSTLVAVVSDGAGSAEFGELGATIVCRTVVARAKGHFGSTPMLPSESDVWAWIDDARDRIMTAAIRRKIDARQFAATLVAVVAADEGSLILHVGDGAAVVKIGEDWISPSWPENGEFASTTFFVTDDPAPRLRVTRVEAAQRVAVFSDGLERLVLNFAERRPHAPFFNGVIRPVEQSQHHGSDRQLASALRRYLNSPAVNDRTDDDKSLILASLQ